jgi:hypothetical protein
MCLVDLEAQTTLNFTNQALSFLVQDIPWKLLSCSDILYFIWFYGISVFIAAITKSRHSRKSLATCNQAHILKIYSSQMYSNLSHPSLLRLPHLLFPLRFYICHLPCLSHPPWFNHPSILGIEYKWWRSSLCRFLNPIIISPFFYPSM